MIENWVLRKIFRSGKEEVTVAACQINIRIIKWRLVRWSRHVACKGRREMCTGFLVVKSEKGHLEYLTVDGRIILKRILKRWDWRHLVQDRYKWEALLHTAINVWFHKLRGISWLNRLTPNDPYMGRTPPLTSKRYILYIYSTNIGTEYFKHAL